MPIYRGRFIPFDASTIADLLSRGETVTPDPDEHAIKLSTQKTLLLGELQRRGFEGSKAARDLITKYNWRKEGG